MYMWACMQVGKEVIKVTKQVWVGNEIVKVIVKVIKHVGRQVGQLLKQVCK